MTAEEKYQKALQHLNELIKLFPKGWMYYFQRGIAYGKLGNYDAAISDYTKAIEINPNYAYAYNNRGNAYKDLEDYDAAIADYTKAIEINPNYAAAYNNRGAAYYYLKNYDAAIADYTKAIEINPNLSVAYGNRELAREKKREADLPQTENEFLTFAKSRGIKFFVHFTRIENLPSIAKHGLLTRKNLDDKCLPYACNDNQRLDNLTDSLSLSVTFPNYRMFYKYGQGSSNWAVILLDAEKILANLHCAFNYTNAANSGIKTRSKGSRMTLDAFKEMFYEPTGSSRKSRGLDDNYTTDPQAEILCLEDIPLKYFVGIVFKNSARTAENQRYFPNVSCSSDSSYFTYRHDWNYWKSNYYIEDEEFY